MAPTWAVSGLLAFIVSGVHGVRDMSGRAIVCQGETALSGRAKVTVVLVGSVTFGQCFT